MKEQERLLFVIAQDSAIELIAQICAARAEKLRGRELNPGLPRDGRKY